MNVRQWAKHAKEEHQNQKGERFFSEKALLSALFEKNGLDRNLLLNAPEQSLEEEKICHLERDLALLLSGYPIQYYLGTEFFCGEEYLVSEGVLIPRPETALLVELGEKQAKEGSVVFDFCCGSGCVGIALLLARLDLKCVSFDLSPEAIGLTEKNRARFGLEERLRVEKCDLLSDEAEKWIAKEKPSLILANPPYLTGEEMERIDDNVKHEPEMALRGGEDGLLFYRRFLEFCAETETPFCMEIGWEQKTGIEAILKEKGLEGEFHRDEAGLWRAVSVMI